MSSYKNDPIPVEKTGPPTGGISRGALPLKFRIGEFLKRSMRYFLANGQTVRWVVQKPVIASLLRDIPMVDCAVDVGCGGGTYAIELLSPRASSVVAIDSDYRHAWLTKSRATHMGARNVHTVVASADALPIKNGIADIVFCCEVLEHVADDGMALSEFARISKTGGRLLCSVPQPPELFPNPLHLREGYTPSELREKLNANGFTVRQMRFCMFELSKLVLKCCVAVRIPVPLLWICYLERRLSVLGSGFADSSAHDVVALSECLNR